MKTNVFLAALLLCLSAFADMGPVPMKEVEIREPVQNAIIFFDQEFHSRRDYLFNLATLKKCAVARWSHDVNLSLIWGKKQDPDYSIEPTTSLVVPWSQSRVPR